MRDSIEKAKQDFDDWVGKWDAALAKGIFEAPPSPPSTSKDTADHSFFGLRQDNHTDSIDRMDSEYWRAINSVADGGVEMQRLDESDAVSTELPNPIRKSTEGQDQAMEPPQLGVTFTEDDIRQLEEMKVKLHDLQSKAAAMEEKNYASQISAMIKKIDAMSDKLGRTNR